MHLLWCFCVCGERSDCRLAKAFVLILVNATIILHHWMRNIILYKLRRTSHYITGDDISLMDIIDIVIRHHEIRCCIRIVPRLEFLYIIVAWHRFILHSEASRADAFKHKLAFAMRVSVIARAPPIATNIIQTQTNFIVPESFAQCYSPLSHTYTQTQAKR